MKQQTGNILSDKIVSDIDGQLQEKTFLNKPYLP